MAELTKTEVLLTDILACVGASKPQRAGAPPRGRVTIDQAGEVSLTQQSFKDECNINRIMAKYRKSGELDHLNTHNPQYGDFDNPDDYQEACNRVMAAQADFNALSAEIRKRFENDPAQLLEFMSDYENEDEAIALGLLPAPPAPEPGGQQGATASESVPDSPSPAPEPTPTPISGGE